MQTQTMVEGWFCCSHCSQNYIQIGEAILHRDKSIERYPVPTLLVFSCNLLYVASCTNGKDSCADMFEHAVQSYKGPVQCYKSADMFYVFLTHVDTNSQTPGSVSCIWSLRIYPVGFAERIRSLYLVLITDGEGAPPTDDALTGPQVFEAVPCSTWDEAHLLPSLKYLRGNKHLAIPEKWLASFPEALELLHKLEEKRGEQTQVFEY